MNLRELRALLDARGLAPRSRHGQNFLVDSALLAAIPGDAGVCAGERVLEVGPGAGALTAELLAAGARILAVEIDAGLAALLRERFAAELAAGTLELLQADVLASGERFAPRVEEWWGEGTPPRVVANLPYAISGPFLGRLPGRPLLGACLLLQREVAEKAAGREAGPLGVRLALGFEVRLGRRVPREVFWPRPEVLSAFLHLIPRSERPTAAEDADLRRLLQEAFGQRRKRVLARMRKTAPAAAAALEAAGVGEDDRPEHVAVAAWWAAVRAHRIARS
ncbi:MAG TPA: rRNA adenine dimethyltransferase family protein [Planctomycetota bacterium]